MSEKNFSEKILQSIKEKHIEPKPKWQFLLKENVVWVLGILSLIIGGLSFSIIFYMMRNNDWDVYQDIYGGLLSFLFSSLPYFWILLLALFIFVAHYNFKHTKKGYRLTLRTIVLGSVVLSVVLGALWYSIGIGTVLDQATSNRFSALRKFHEQRHSRWLQTEHGLLGGQILWVEKNRMTLKDFDSREWIVDIQDAKIFSENNLKENERVRIIGQKTNDLEFRADKILPWKPLFRKGPPRNERKNFKPRITE